MNPFVFFDISRTIHIESKKGGGVLTTLNSKHDSLTFIAIDHGVYSIYEYSLKKFP
jgi:hypothetical protein